MGRRRGRTAAQAKTKQKTQQSAGAESEWLPKAYRADPTEPEVMPSAGSYFDKYDMSNEPRQVPLRCGRDRQDYRGERGKIYVCHQKVDVDSETEVDDDGSSSSYAYREEALAMPNESVDELDAGGYECVIGSVKAMSGAKSRHDAEVYSAEEARRDGKGQRETCTRGRQQDRAKAFARRYPGLDDSRFAELADEPAMSETDSEEGYEEGEAGLWEVEAKAQHDISPGMYEQRRERKPE
ncbi:uncharacterized protein L969DRAFT_84669 [Mixia osmundae IAM 14324]|uniref:Uncharacterized protein n=1 Tax=Mixia osmundae (strain CBS 9802 / IAM 14324 / JCM 22182 / KY 12970) TaxID=764103 RepID=G7DTN6_MIXOS|nr:uncharacterized protein L969DRAFT_84669 [Mixia osmundae IAM 14324]KEI42783.1 hypothetical protein L969DRAFT_84669 [Mixia osmundae IAM 14324]GAA93883.1 hypothetical protein E5Q_00529 [Mixia osmundae IAM 14324]